MHRPFLRQRLGLVTSLVCSWLLGSACSSSKDERQAITSTPQDYCQRACDKAHLCNDATDVAECRSSCQALLAAKPTLRADFLGYVAACVESSTCSLSSASKCKKEAQAQLSATSYGLTLCTAFISASDKCGASGAGYPEDTCLTAAKSYDDSALKAANDCLSKSCASLSACLMQALPAVMLAP
ncbi:MAG TPA: hypothetical protein VER04_08110 [Polyangiaceae bacterium]|nr:hypothetical protein [Polyangiaceae bacterium]